MGYQFVLHIIISVVHFETYIDLSLHKIFR